MDDAETLTLPLHCADCGAAHAVKIERRNEGFARAVRSSWYCSACQRQNFVKFAGTILRVTSPRDIPKK